jgi:hypothetical protein
MFSIISNIKILDNDCENALIDFPFHENTETWLSDHQLLFNSCSNITKEINIDSILNEHKAYIDKFVAIYLMHCKK